MGWFGDELYGGLVGSSSLVSNAFLHFVVLRFLNILNSPFWVVR